MRCLIGNIALDRSLGISPMIFQSDIVLRTRVSSTNILSRSTCSLDRLMS
jgi:hypothetical protein